MSEESPLIEKKEILYEGFFSLQLDHLQREEKKMSYLVLDIKADGVVVLARNKGKYLLLKEYRHPLRQYIYGLPGGRVEEGESLKQNAQREFLEETGYKVSSLQYLGFYLPLPSISQHRIHLFYSSEIEKSASPKRESFEFMEVIFLEEELIFAKMQGKELFDTSIHSAFFYKKFLSS